MSWQQVLVEMSTEEGEGSSVGTGDVHTKIETATDDERHGTA
jgi:glutamate 5-kinase